MIRRVSVQTADHRSAWNVYFGDLLPKSCHATALGNVDAVQGDVVAVGTGCAAASRGFVMAFLEAAGFAVPDPAVSLPARLTTTTRT